MMPHPGSLTLPRPLLQFLLYAAEALMLDGNALRGVVPSELGQLTSLGT